MTGAEEDRDTDRFHASQDFASVSCSSRAEASLAATAVNLTAVKHGDINGWCSNTAAITSTTLGGRHTGESHSPKKNENDLKISHNFLGAWGG